MSETYTRENFRPDVVPGALRADAKDLIGVAVSVGWAAHVQSGHGVSLEAPPPNDSASDNPQFIKFATTERAGAKNMASIQRKVMRYADPTLVNREYEAKTKKARERRRAEEKAFAEAEKKAELARAQMKKESTPVEFVKELPKKGEKQERYIVKEEPLLVYASQNRGYYSESTLKREWSDGSVDYACRVPECGFASESRYGPSRGHRRSHIERGEVEHDERRTKENTFYVPNHEPAWTRADQPEEERTEATEDAVEVVPTEDTESVLAKIRNLLDDGENARLRDENAALKEQLASLEADLSEAKSARQKAEDDLGAIHDMTRRDKEAS